MQTPLPLASYAFILRKHVWLVLGVTATVLGAGFWYAKSMDPVFRATATVQIQSPAVPAGADKTFVIRDDPTFVANQVYRIRKDPHLAAEVKAHLLREDAAAPGDGAGAGAGAGDLAEPALPDPALFRGLDPRSMPGMVAVTQAPPTSYFEISARGPDRAVNTAVANAYAVVFARTFRRERERQFLGALKDTRDRLDARRRDLAGANDEIEKFKKGHAGKMDLEKEVSAIEQETFDSLRKDYQQARNKAGALERELETVRTVLRAAGLEIADRGEAGFEVAARDGGDAETLRADLLDPRVQSLDVVAGHEGARQARESLDQLEADKIRLRDKLRPGTPEATELDQDIRSRIEALERNTSAALAKVAHDAARARKAEDDLAKAVKDGGDRLAQRAEAMAGLERLQKEASAAEAEVDSLQALVLERERARERMEADGGTVRVHLFAQPGEAELVAPNKPVIYAATIVAAILLAAGLAYVLEFLDDTVKTREDFDRLVRLPFLGYVPHLREEEGKSRDLVVARGRTGSPEVESFRALRTGVQFSRPDREVRTFLVTSAGPAEGKTTVSVNLASAFTGGKGRVLLVDADLRRARVHSALGIDNARGLTNVLVGEATLEGAVQRSSVEGLDVLSSGPIPPNPAEVLGSERMQELLREAAARYDRVIVDSPPLVAVTDPALLAKYVDAVFLVISIGRTSIRTIQRARETLAAVGAGIHGAILNNADVKVSGYYHSYGGYAYGYGYGYGERKPEAAAKA